MIYILVSVIQKINKPQDNNKDHYNYANKLLVDHIELVWFDFAEDIVSSVRVVEVAEVISPADPLRNCQTQKGKCHLHKFIRFSMITKSCWSGPK